MANDQKIPWFWHRADHTTVIDRRHISETEREREREPLVKTETGPVEPTAIALPEGALKWSLY